MKNTVLILSALIAPTIAVAQDGARPISLVEAVTLARKNSPSMIQARGSTRTQAAALRTARWAYNPLSNITLNYGSSINGGAAYVEGVKVDRPATSWSFNQSFGSASLTLWDGGKKFADKHTAEARVDAAEIGETSQSFTIAQQVKTQYYTILRQIEALATARQQLSNAELQMRLAKARVAQGAATISDTLQATITIATANNAILTAQNAISTANANLTRLVAADYAVTAIVSDTTDPPPFTMSDESLFALVDQAPTVRTAVATLAVSKSSEKSTRSQLWPQVTAGGTFGRSNQEKTHGGFTGYDFGAGPMNYSWGFSLGATYTLFNNWTRESNLLNAKVSIDNSEASLRDAKLTFRQNMTQQIGQLRVSDQQIVLARIQLAASEENLRVIQRRYELGAATQLELTNAQQSLTTSRNQLTNFRFDARNARTAIETLIGRDLPQQ